MGITDRSDRDEGVNVAVDVQIDRRMVTIKQACALASVSRRTMYNWMNMKKVEFVRTATGNVRIYADSLFRNADGSR